MNSASQDPASRGDPSPTGTNDPRAGAGALPPSRFHWNRGGWIGAQFGSTAWMLAFTIIAWKTDPVVAAVAGACFFALNIAGFVLWSRRETLSAYAGIQSLVGLAAIAIAIVVFAIRSSEKLAELPEDSPISGDVPWAVLGIAPLLMLMLHTQQRAHDRRLARLSEQGEESSPP